MTKKMGRPSQGRTYKLQVQISPAMRDWLERSAGDGCSISSAAFKILKAVQISEEKKMETITIMEACEILGCTASVLEQLIQNENVLVVDEGRSMKIIKASLEGVDVDLLRDPDNDCCI